MLLRKLKKLLKIKKKESKRSLISSANAAMYNFNEDTGDYTKFSKEDNIEYTKNILDEIAREAGIDPSELRAKFWVESSDGTNPAVVWDLPKKYKEKGKEQNEYDGAIGAFQITGIAQKHLDEKLKKKYKISKTDREDPYHNALFAAEAIAENQELVKESAKDMDVSNEDIRDITRLIFWVGASNRFPLLRLANKSKDNKEFRDNLDSVIKELKLPEKSKPKPGQMKTYLENHDKGAKRSL